MSKQCKGCGAYLQYEKKDQIGYTPKVDSEYCQRCFRITHYDDVIINMQQGIDSDAILNKVAMMDALVLWVVDLFDFEANIIKGMNRHLANKDIILVATKRDLLPSSVGNEKLAQFLIARLKEKGIFVSGIVISGDLAKNAFAKDNDSLKEIHRAIRLYRKNRDVVVIGMANAGKSTLLNALLQKECLTTSRHPGTTLDFNGVKYHDYMVYDTPGLTRYDSLLTHMEQSMLKQVIPTKTIKPLQFQLKEDQSLALAGLVRLDISGCQKATCVCYFAPALKVHRGKLANANKLWSEHLGDELLSPTLDHNYTDMKVMESKMFAPKIDVVIHGLGWFAISGDVKNIKVYVNEKIDITFRGAMI
ncbi:MAG: ribosome biogenesis GTPase YqeH [Erysipelotrichia bacterium]|nr:ribosome biogenesis GTPase YqeH [Erysipelotrichia bacterium]NCC54279.1 ribosome biogenesis GTPase YqeH [Erysipelotrichia bacterium]